MQQQQQNNNNNKAELCNKNEIIILLEYMMGMKNALKLGFLYVCLFIGL